MKVLEGLRVLAWRRAAEGALARLLEDLGATVERCDEALDAARLAAADVLIEQLGLPRIEETGLTRKTIEAANPRLVHVSVTTFGSHGPRARWHGSARAGLGSSRCLGSAGGNGAAAGLPLR